MSVDISKIEVGDTVTLVPLEVVDAYHDSIIVMGFKGLRSAFSFDQIAAHHPKPCVLEIGQQVLKMEDIYGAAVTGPWVVIGIHKHRVWLGAPEGERETYAQTTRDNLKYVDGTRVGA